MNPTTLKFFVKEDGNDFPVNHMSGQETASIEECVSDLFPRSWDTPYWFETDTCLYDDEDMEDEDGEYKEPDFGLVRCFIRNPKPNNGSQGASRLPHPIPQEVLNKFAGKTFRVYPRQFGINPWGQKVEIIFESLGSPSPPPAPPVPPTPNPEPAPAPAPAPAPPKPKAGIPAFDLISRALAKQSKSEDDFDIPDDALISLTEKGRQLMRLFEKDPTAAMAMLSADIKTH